MLSASPLLSERAKVYHGSEVTMSESPAPAEKGRPKREAKAVENFTIEEKEKAEFVIGAGAGEKLGDIENVKVKMDKLPGGGEELKTFHRLCFGRPGSKTMVKKNLREFSGLTISGVELERREASVTKLDGKMIKALLTLCDLSTSGTKANNVETLMGFLKSPSSSGKKSIVQKAGEKRARNERKKAKVWRHPLPPQLLTEPDPERRAAALTLSDRSCSVQAEKKKGKRGKKAAKPANALKKPPSAYILYCNNKREKVKAENPEASQAVRAAPRQRPCIARAPAPSLCKAHCSTMPLASTLAGDYEDPRREVEWHLRRAEGQLQCSGS